MIDYKTLKNYILASSLILAFGLSGCSDDGNEQNKPNIIFILADDMGYGDVSSYNENGKINTKNIDQLAAEGIKFTDAHTTAPVCTPSRLGLLTGRYNWRSRLKKGNVNGRMNAIIPTTRTTVASMLQKNGYQTAFIGKWHLGWNWALKDSSIVTKDFYGPDAFSNVDFSKPVTKGPNDLGFDYAYGHAASLDMAPYVYVENGNVTQFPHNKTVSTDVYGWWREGPTSEDFIHEDVTPNFFRKAISYIHDKGKDKKPFFLYLALPSPHTPILPSEEWLGKSGVNPYGDFVMMIDDYVGQLLSALKEDGLEDNTLVVFATDNGGAPAAKIDVMEAKGHYSSYIYRGNKFDIYEGGHRVPFIAKWPNKIKKGLVSDETICTADFMATCADIVGYSLLDNEGEDSYSMVPLFEQEKLDKPFREATIHHSVNGSFAIRKGEWKLIMCPGSGGHSYPTPKDEIFASLPPIQLYNLKDDPSETNNLQAENTAKVEELKSLLVKLIKDGRSTPGIPQKNDAIDFEWTQANFIN